MDYCSLADVKGVLQIASAETKHDTQLATCITGGSALVDGFLKAKTLSVPSAVPALVVCSSKFFAAWEFRRSSDPVGAEAFWIEANRFLAAYVEAEAEPYVGGCVVLGKKAGSLKPKAFSGTLRLVDGSEFLVEIRISPLEGKV